MSPHGECRPEGRVLVIVVADLLERQGCRHLFLGQYGAAMESIAEDRFLRCHYSPSGGTANQVLRRRLNHVEFGRTS